MTPFTRKASIVKAPTRATMLARSPRLPLSSALLVTLGTTLCAPAHAYLGPGAGLGVFGTLFGIVAAIVLALFGLLWYPLKRAFGKKASAGAASASEPSPPAADKARADADVQPHDTSDPKE